MGRSLPAHVQAAVDKARAGVAAAKALPVAKAKPKRHGMNGLEAAWAEELRARELRGEVLWWRYEAIRLRLADGSFYRPDFLVLTSACELECHETKGHMREAARVRLLVAAEIYPFRFILVRREGGAWAFQEVPER